MANMASFIWFTVVVVGILVFSLAMISMGAACWGNCGTVPALAEYLVVTGSLFFCLLIMLLLLTFCICTSSGDPKIRGPLKIVYGITVTVMYFLVIAGSTLLYLRSSKERECNKTNSLNQQIYQLVFNSSGTFPDDDGDDFCSEGLQTFSFAVMILFHVLLFFSLLVTFYDNPNSR